VTIRLAEKLELPHIMKLFSHCTAHMIAQGIDQWDEHYPNAEVVEQSIVSGSMYAYFKDDLICGVITLHSSQPTEYETIQWQSGQDAECLVVYRLGVDPGLQGLGIATKLMGFAEWYAGNHSLSSIRLDCYSKNERALSFYQHLHYEIRGTVIFPHSDVPFYCLEKRIR
jgi:GNAT superfamily N-acetyltransferase